MGKGEVMGIDEFEKNIDKSLGDLLKYHGLSLEEKKYDKNKYVYYCLYKNNWCAIKIFDDVRNGETNCFIKIENDNDWKYLQLFLSDDERFLLRSIGDSFPPLPWPEGVSLKWVRKILEYCLPIIRGRTHNQ